MLRTIFPMMAALIVGSCGASLAAADGSWSERDQRIITQASAGGLRLTSAKIIGVRPGTPLIHTITASGAKSPTIAVSGLPNGVQLDAATGIVTGMVKTPGTYPLQVTVSAAGTTCTETVVIVCGDALALTPPLGWNSYDAYGDGVDEAQFLANVAWFKEHLQRLGYDTVVVDFRWYDRLAKARTPVRQGKGTAESDHDANGRLLPAPNRFPSAADGRGFTTLADKVHAQGLKFGIHIMRGISRVAVDRDLPIAGSTFTAKAAANTKSHCSWSTDMYGINGASEAGRAWYRSLAQQYASWGVDFIKADDMSAPYQADEIAALSDGLRTCGRSIVLSLSPGETPVNQAAHVGRYANMWRNAGDFWDDWKSLEHAHRLYTAWSATGITGPGHWPDGDMLPLGKLSLGGSPVGKERQTRFSHDEQILMMSLWSIMPAPLMIGASLEYPDPWMTAMLTNAEMLAINQDPLGKAARRVTDSAQGLAIWVRELSGGDVAVAVINTSNAQVNEALPWSAIQQTTARPARDIWTGDQQPANIAGLSVSVPVHGAQLFRLAKP